MCKATPIAARSRAATPRANPRAVVRAAMHLAMLGLALPAAACVTGEGAPTEEALAAADYGPVPIEHEARTRKFVLGHYRQYQVIEVESGEPRKAWFGHVGGAFEQRDVRYGWAVKFRGFRLGFMGITAIVTGELFFRDDVIEGVADDRAGFRFLPPKARPDG
ncbi:MAG TPA: hypothetical protein VFZ65_17135 [Planctomycetota bacterium]|nr:hypothetical protein [Planctomycetota bacterium]